MTIFSYSKSDIVIENVRRLEMERIRIHGLLLSRNDELRYRWEAKAMRTYYSLSLYEPAVRMSTVTDALSAESTEDTIEAKEARAFSSALETIDAAWYMATAPVETDDIIQLYRSVWKNKMVLTRAQLDEALKLVVGSGEHPIVQALIAQAIIFCTAPFEKRNGAFSHLVNALFMSKNGLDFRGVIVPERSYYLERAYFMQLMKNACNEGNLTEWIEYATGAMAEEAKRAHEAITERAYQFAVPENYFQLSDRERSLLARLDEPEKTVSNRKVQEWFNLSAPTAARLLARLASLGMLVSHGKGRSTVYTRA